MVLVWALSVLMAGANVARAAYPGANGAIAFETFNVRYSGVIAGSDAIKAGSATLARCDPVSSSQPCEFGRPSYSPDGKTIVFTRGVPAGNLADPSSAPRGFDQGALTLAGATGSGQHSLPRQTRGDEDPAFLPSGVELVFDGRTSPSAPENLFTVGVDGMGLRQLTTDGGSQPAPCRTGTIAFVRRGDIYLLARDRRSQHRLTSRGGTDPDCSPDGHRIAFVRHGALYTIGNSGRHVRRIASPQIPPSDRDSLCEGGGLSRGSVYADAFAPDGRRIAFLAHYTGSDTDCYFLEVVDLRGHPSARPAVVASNNGINDVGEDYAAAAGLSWQPV